MPRDAAYLCIRSGSTIPLREVDRVSRSRGLDPRDTALVRRLVGTEVRRRGTLRALVGAFAHHKPKADLATFMRLGLAQILYLNRVPDHAAVSETVRAAADQLGLSKGRIVNGVLRNALRELKPGASGDPTQDIVGANVHFAFPLFRDPSEHPHLWAEDALSIPSALHKRWTQRYGLETANALSRLAGQEPGISLRVTSDAAGARDAIASELGALDITLVHGKHPSILLGPTDSMSVVLGSDAFREGRITVQGEHALRAAELAGDVAGHDVLDVCAAPGGKAAVFSAQSPKSLVAIDLSPSRLAKLHGAGERLTGTPASLVAMDGVEALRPGAQFDTVFLDAPCSNTGVLGARPGARWRYGPKSQNELAALQQRLVTSAANHVRPGGALVYSTCSMEPEENSHVLRAWLAESSGFELESEIESVPGGSAEGGPVDGGYAARYRRS